LHRKHVVRYRKDRLQHGDTQHDGRGADHDLHVPCIDALIYDALDQPRDCQIHNNDQDQKNQRGKAAPPVRPDKVQ
jgi:hypothetical protein